MEEADCESWTGGGQGLVEKRLISLLVSWDTAELPGFGPGQNLDEER